MISKVRVFSTTLRSQKKGNIVQMEIFIFQYALNEDDVIATPYKSALELPVLNEGNSLFDNKQQYIPCILPHAYIRLGINFD